MTLFISQVVHNVAALFKIWRWINNIRIQTKTIDRETKLITSGISFHMVFYSLFHCWEWGPKFYTPFGSTSLRGVWEPLGFQILELTTTRMEWGFYSMENILYEATMIEWIYLLILFVIILIYLLFNTHIIIYLLILFIVYQKRET